MICSGGRGFEPHRGQRFSLFLRVDHFHSRANAQKVSFGTILEHFNLPHLNHYHIVLLFYFSQREVTAFDYDIVTGKIVNKRQAVPIDESYGVSTS